MFVQIKSPLGCLIQLLFQIRYMFRQLKFHHRTKLNILKLKRERVIINRHSNGKRTNFLKAGLSDSTYSLLKSVTLM